MCAVEPEPGYDAVQALAVGIDLLLT